MADISKITLPNGSSYDIKDATARSGLAGKAEASHTHTKSQITDFPTIPTYGVATASALGLVKSGTDITVDSSGNVSVNDDSHNHVISNVDGLQSALDGKADSSHNHSNYALKSIYDVKGINLGGKAEGMWSSAIGFETTASGKCSHAEGSDYLENGTDRISRRSVTISDVVYTIAGSTAYGTNSHAEGTQTFAYGYSSHAEGNGTTASGKCSHAEGSSTIASEQESHAEGKDTTASGIHSHAEGYITTASKDNSHAEGNSTTASGSASHAEGSSTTASGMHSHAEGYKTTASGSASHAEGNNTTAKNGCSHAGGHYNVDMVTGGGINNTKGTAFVIGNGTMVDNVITKSNAFSVMFDGKVKAMSTITASTTADYAEFFEWLDENPDSEDRVGYFVTMDGDKIRIANSDDDYILGVVSGEPFVLGNGDCDTWNGMFLHDEFRRTIYEPAPKIKEILDDEGKPTGEFEEIEGKFEGTKPKLNPEYDHTKTYISRFDRPEWSPVGMLGVLAVRHDGTAKVNGYVTIADGGIATACDKNTENSYRVIKANSDLVVEIIFR